MRRVANLLVIVILVALAPSARAAIEVVDDEIIFTIDAPGASAVYLVGDFNNWNPTLEKMEKIGDTFQTLLFIDPGVYHYQFIIDGEWIFDPDNEHKGEPGSLVVLENRADALVVATEDYLARLQPQSGLVPGIRYAGNFGNDDGDSKSQQDLDIYVHYEQTHLAARFNLKTVDGAWGLDPFESGLKFDRGFLAATVGKSIFRAFENDSSWTSSDPFTLVGAVGVFDYNVGFARKGLTFEMLNVGGVHVRTWVADKLDTFPERPLQLQAQAFGDFASGTSTDTTVYAYTDTHDDADSWALEFDVDQKNWGLGFGKRRNHGMHDGLIANAERAGGGFDVTAATSRETWDANVVWGRWRFIDEFALAGGYGYSNAQLRTTNASFVNSASLDGVSIGQQAESFETRTRIQTSQRAHFRLDYEEGDGGASGSYHWAQFDFDSPLYEVSDAFVNDYELTGYYGRGQWRGSLLFGYLSQRYGTTPVDMHYFTPARNYWLDYDDKLDPGNMVRFDLTRSTTIGGDFQFNPRLPFGWQSVEAHASLTAVADAEFVFDEFFGDFQHMSFEVGVERGIYERFYGQADVRVAHYDKQAWMVSKTYAAPYLELGYRHDNIELSLGFGQDPVVLDRVQNMYFRNGRLKRLTRAVPAGLTREQSAELGEALQAEEQRLRDDRTLKLEVIVGF